MTKTDAKQGWILLAIIAVLWFGGLTLLYGWKGMVATTVVVFFIGGKLLSDYSKSHA